MAEHNNPSEEQAAQPLDIRLQPVVYRLPTMNEAVVRSDITYKTTASGDLKMDVYYPGDYEGETRLPAVIFVHGDAEPELLKNIKDASQYTCWGQLSAASGLIAVTFNHRSSESLTKIYEVASDIEGLIRYVRDNSDMLGIDANRICIWSASAGSPYGLQAALRDDTASIRCIVCYYGLTDLHVYYDTTHKDASTQGAAQEPVQAFPYLSEEVLNEFSASHMLNKAQGHVAPLFIARAGKDHPAINASIDRLITAAIARNAELDVMNHATGRHAFDILDNNLRSREIIKATLSFMKTHLNP